ncbi:protein ELYS [Gastrophryne carolinensis]
MQNLTAQVTSEVLQFPDATLKALQEDEIQLDSVVRARFTSGKSGLAWLACGPQLEVTNCLTGERLSAYHFSGVTERPPTVVAVTEFSWQKKTGLLVGLVEAEGSVLCLYDVGISRVVKAVVLPGSVTAVEPIINHGGASASTQHLHQSLRWFFGVAAVVTDVGHVLLIDLCLDDVSNSQDELDASDLEVMSGIPSEIPKLREAAAKARRHLCLQLLAPSGTAVSALCYISRTNQLAVGFSDGYLSLWNMKTLRREYHVQIEGGKVPVSSVTFQEPENDPRNCCYLWAVQATPSGGEVSLHLLQLAFGDRKCLASGHILYENLEYCEERYSLNLSTNSLRSQANSTKLLSCQTIEKFRAHSEREDGPHEVTSPDTSVTVFSWQVTTYGHGKPSVYMAVFDINRWYQAQMPDSLRPGPFLRNCSYFAFWSLESVVDVTQDGIFDILVHERSFSRGAPPSYPPPEQFYYPSTYNFDATCLLISGVIHIACTGFQKETLYYLKNFGGSLNETVPDSYSRCLVAGLLSPRLADIQPSNMSQEEQLQAVLSAAVETSSISLLTRCIKQWTAEEQPRSAGNLRFVLEWTWDKVVNSKKEFDRLCVPLFDGTCNFIDPQTLQSLHHCQLRLANLSAVLNCFLTEAQELTKQGFIDLTNKQSVTKLLAQYTSVVLWFCRCGLLPDYLDETMQLTRPYYNYNIMQQYYTERRKKLESLSRGKWKTSSLMIDGMVGQLGEKIEQLWKRDEGGTGKYPPANLHALLDLYLLEDSDEINKHAITIYFLLDIMYSFPDKPDTAIESFPTAFSVPCGLIKLIQGFWLLDHNDCQNSVDCILHPAASRVMAWQHNQIIETLMCQGDYRQALRYIQVMKPPAVSSTEVKRHITVLLANKNLIEAWNLQRLHSTRLNVEDLLKHMYETCQEMGIVEELLKLTFTDSEHDYLQRFLQAIGGVQNQELLLIHHLQRANYIQALQLNQSLKSSHVGDLDRRLRERAVVRNSILDQYGKILPRVQRALASERAKPYALSSTIWKEVTRPKPLSTVAKQAPPGSVITKANFISNVLMKIKEVSSADVQKDFSPYKSLATEELEPLTTSSAFDAQTAFVGTPVSKARRMSRLIDSIVHPVLTEPSLLETDFELPSERTTHRSSVFMTSSPEKTNLLKIAQLKNMGKASEFNLLETPVVVKRAKALAASSVSSVYSAHTPLSILRSSARTTPLVSPSVSPGRSITPPLRPREAKISFMEQINNFTKENLTAIKQMPVASPIPKSQDSTWTGNLALSADTSIKVLSDMDNSSSGVQDRSPSKMETSREISNISAQSDQTTLEYHDAPTPEDLEEEPVILQSNSRLSIEKNLLPPEADHVFAEVVQPQEMVQESEAKDTENENVLGFFVPENDLVLHQLTSVQEIDVPVNSDLKTEEENLQPATVDPECVSSTQDSASVISIHDSEEIVSTYSEHQNEEMEVEVNDIELQFHQTMAKMPEESPSSLLSHGVIEEVIKENEAFESEPGTNIYHQLCPITESQIHFNVENIEQCFDNQLSNERISTEKELDDGESEHDIAPGNFTLMLEGDAGEDEAVENDSLPADSKVEVLKTPSVSPSLPKERSAKEIEIDSCPSNAFTLVDGTQETQIVTLLNVPEVIKVAVEENVVDVFNDPKSKNVSMVNFETVEESEHVKKPEIVQSPSRKYTRKMKKSNSKEDNDRLSHPITPPKTSEIHGAEEQDASAVDKSVVNNPQTPRRSVRKVTKVNQNSTDGPEVKNPPTPKRGGRKTKENIEHLTPSSTQEEQPSSHIVRRTRNSVPEKITNLEVEMTNREEVSIHLPNSPARTRRNKGPVLDQVIEEKEDNLSTNIAAPTTPSRITRSSKIIQAEEPINKTLEMSENEQTVTTPTRGQRGKRAVNELVKHFELNVTQPSSKTDSSPPASPPKRVPLRWSRIKSEDNITHKTVSGENLLSQEQTVDTPRKRARRAIVSKTIEESKNPTENSLLEPDEAVLGKQTKKGKAKKGTLPLVAEESVDERAQELKTTASQDVGADSGTHEKTKSMRVTRTRSSNASLFPDTSMVTFAFTTPTPRRRKNAKEQAAPPVSPEVVQPAVSQYVFSPPSLRTRRTNKTHASVTENEQEKIPAETEAPVPEEPVVRPSRARGRPPKQKAAKDTKPTDKTAWSPPPVEIQLLSPPESPAADSKSVKPSSAEKKSVRRTRRIVSKPVTRRKIR